MDELKKVEKQNRIMRMYVEDGLSMMQIATQLGISPSVVRYSLEKNGIQRRSISEAIFRVYRTRFGKKPFHVKSTLNSADEVLKVAGTMLYWGEGAKTGNVVNFSNSDPEMIAVFLEFLRKICGVAEERIKILIHRYPDQDPRFLEDFWSRITKIPRSNFYRSHVHAGKKGTYKSRSKYGTIAIHYSDKMLLKVILDWVEDYKVGYLDGQRSSIGRAIAL